jgi:acyl carrier protein
MNENRQKLTACFTEALNIPAARVVDTLAYQSIPQWDSVAHMALVAQLEASFDVMLDTDQILGMSSVAKAIEILTSHGVSFA